MTRDEILAKLLGNETLVKAIREGLLDAQRVLDALGVQRKSKVFTWIDDDVPPEVVRAVRKQRPAAVKKTTRKPAARKADKPSGGVDLAALRRIAARAKSSQAADLEKLDELRQDAKIPDDLYDLLVRALGHDRLEKLLRDTLSGRTAEAQEAARRRGEKSASKEASDLLDRLGVGDQHYFLGFPVDGPIPGSTTTTPNSLANRPSTELGVPLKGNRGQTGPTFLGYNVNEEPK